MGDLGKSQVRQWSMSPCSLYGSKKKSALGLILSSSPYLISARKRFPFLAGLSYLSSRPQGKWAVPLLHSSSSILVSTFMRISFSRTWISAISFFIIFGWSFFHRCRRIDNSILPRSLHAWEYSFPAHGSVQWASFPAHGSKTSFLSG